MLKTSIKIDEFLCSHFNIEDGRKFKNIFSLLCFIISKSKNATEMEKKKICSVYGEGAVIGRMCQKWCVVFLGTVDIVAK